MLLPATENAVAGHIWPAGRYLPTPGLDEPENKTRINQTEAEINTKNKT